MIYAYFDSGTSNSRIFLLKNGQVLYHATVQTGCRDAALAGNSSILVQALWELYQNALKALQLQDDQVCALYLSGMATSSNGLLEVEHLSLPVNLSQLRHHCVSYLENSRFHRTFLLVPGLKTCPRGIRVSPEEAFRVNNVRGEETEIMGILRYTGLTSCVILLPGSHTQAAVVENGNITDLLSTVTGELYGAVIKDTIIGSSVNCTACCQPQWVQRGVMALRQFGFNRALYITRSLELFSETTAEERKSFLEGVINGDMILEAIRVLRRHPPIQKLVIYGSPEQLLVLQAAAEACPEAKGLDFLHVTANPDFPMSVYGIMALCENGTTAMGKQPMQYPFTGLCAKGAPVTRNFHQNELLY